MTPRSRKTESLQTPGAWWSRSAESLLASLHSSADGISVATAARRLLSYGPNTLRASTGVPALKLLLRQFASPLVLILVFAATVSGVLQQWTDSLIILAIVFGSGTLGFAQEYHASAAVERLRARIRILCNVMRGGKTLSIPSEAIVPGDIILLSAGSLVPADGALLEAKDFFVAQAALTGEPYPVEKQPGIASENAGIAARLNCVFMGTSVRSGTARMLAVKTGKDTEFGAIAGRLRLSPPETEFERGLRSYSYLLTRVMIVLVVVVFATNILLHRPPVDSLLFAVALAVGISPELLPAIVSITLSRGAREMAAHGVIVRRLEAIENLGSMDVLCTDKTGTLTKGVMDLGSVLDAEGHESTEILKLACLNASLQTGLPNPLDEAIVARAKKYGVALEGWHKLDEVPYDFVRKRLSVLVAQSDSDAVLITKGAMREILDISDQVSGVSDTHALDAAGRAVIEKLFSDYSGQGYRVLGLATKPMNKQHTCARTDEAHMIFRGLLLFLDPLKDDIHETLAELSKLGVGLKIISGDNRLVAAHLARSINLDDAGILTGDELAHLTDEALGRRADRAHVFAEIDPNQKERIILALKRIGHVVGYMGDGINDAPALHAADTGISVDQAVDVAKEAADFVLLKHDLNVLRQGVELGRNTFVNTLKYISITTSANFGNMISMAVASLFMPFLPLLAKQILLNNFLSDLPAIGIASDNVDREMVERPRRWRIASLRNFMLIFGSISSLFDMLTFAVLLLGFHTKPEIFRTAWFIESLLTELVIALVIRTYRPFYKSAPGRVLWISTLCVFAVTLAIPYLPGVDYFGFVGLAPAIMLALLAIVIAYIAASEFAKLRLYRHD